MSRPKSNPRGRIRRWTRRLVILLVLLVVALAALTAVAPRIAGAYLDGRTLNAPAGPSGATIRLEQLRLRWTGAQEVGAFTLTDNATGDAVAQGALSASVTLLDLLQGTTDLGVVTLTGSADLTADESGLPAILQSPPDDRAGAAPGAPSPGRTRSACATPPPETPSSSRLPSTARATGESILIHPRDASDSSGPTIRYSTTSPSSSSSSTQAPKRTEPSADAGRSTTTRSSSRLPRNCMRRSISRRRFLP